MIMANFFLAVFTLITIPLAVRGIPVGMSPQSAEDIERIEVAVKVLI